MKKIILFLVVLMLGVGAAYALPFDKYTIDRKELPQEAQNTLTTYFPKAKVSMIKCDRHLLKKTDYEVRLTDGTTLEFRNNGKWKEIDCQNRQVPDGLVINPIKKFVTKNYPGTYITKIEKDGKGYEVELSDNIELKFDLLGTFKKAKMDN